MSRPQLKNIVQVGVIVDDLEKYVKKYADEYGIGPWYVYGAESVSRMSENFATRGKVVNWQSKMARCRYGNVEIELIEPADDKSIHYEHLQKHGPGMHHVLFLPEDYNECVEFMKSKGIEEIGSGGLPGGVKFAYYGTEEDLGFVTEIAYFPPDAADWPPDMIYPPQD